MTWLQLRLDTQPGRGQALEDLMLATGAVAVTMEDNADQPVLEPGVGETPLWGQTRLTGLYPADTDMDAVLAAFPAELLRQANQRVEILEDKDWEREWMQHYQPMQFGSRLWVCPSWLEPPEPDAVNLLLDPGLAFGTGTHPTTALCLRSWTAWSWTERRGRLRLRLRHPRGRRPETGRRQRWAWTTTPRPWRPAATMPAQRHTARRLQVALPGDFDQAAWRRAPTW